MADYRSPRAEKSSTSEMKRKKKRKLPHSENKHEVKASKLSRMDQSDALVNEPIEEDTETTTEVLEVAAPWRNLQLILSLQKKNLTIEKKVELAYEYVNLSYGQVADETIQPSEAVSSDRVINFLNNWVQSTLISSEKEIRVSGLTPQFGVSGSCLDYKCWKIFKFCLENGMKLHVSLSFSKDIFKVIHCITRNMEIKDLNDDEFTLYNTMLDCISLIFTSHGGVSNENLDLWILLVGTLLELVLKVITDKLNGSRSGTVVLNLACVVLEPFIKFLRLHPNKKNGFQDFVDKLLEPLLCLLHLLHPYDLSSSWMSKLLKLIEEVLSQGLFHPSHIDGFLSLQSLSKYKISDDGKPKDSKTVIRSYHRHLFDKLGRIVVEKKALALFVKGDLFRLYVHSIKRQDGLSVLSGEIRKSLFDFFVQIMEPLLGDIDIYLQDGVEVGSVLEDVHCTLKSFNSILISLMQEKVYARVDDTSEGACANFLKLICDKVTLLSAKIDGLVSSSFNVKSGTCKDLVGLVAKEVVSCLDYLLEIDYEVLGNDLESLWLLMFSYGTLGHNSTNLPEKPTIIPEILHLGCHMVNLYSELRQVGTSVFALCKAIRRSRGIEANHSEAWSKSLRLILCSPELRLSIHNAVKSIPEGQVGLSIKELATDVSESLEWMKGTLDNSCHDVQLKAEVLGSGLSEVYALILDSLMVTTGNSSLVGVSLNALVTVISPSMSVLISQPKDGVYEFLSMVSGRKFSNQVGSHWIFLFFFRLYMSSRSLYRQAISLASPNTSKKMSEVMRDSFTAYSGNDWLEKTEKDEGYFSWIVQPSVSLLLILEEVSDVCTKESTPDRSPLTYVLNAMAIQRLVDLNRLVKSFEFVVKKNDMIIDAAKDEEGIYGKQNKQLGKRLLKLTEEARGLASYIMGHLSLLNKCQLHYEDGWDFAVAAVDEKSLPSAYWCLICQNIDIWSTHAAKKKLKKFLSILLQHSLPYVSSNFKQFGEQNGGGDGNLKTVTMQEISLELLSNTMLYEEKFVRRHMASRFCCFFQELVAPLLCTGVDIELQAEPNWPEVLSSLKILSVASNNINEVNEGSSRDPSSSLSIKKRCSEQEFDQSSQMYKVCQSSLDFLCWMPKRWMSSKSFSLYATCILNLERLIVDTLLGDKFHDHYELLRLLLCCRKTLKHLMVTFCEENLDATQNSLTALHFKGKFPALWLLKSLLSVQQTFQKDNNTQVTNLIFSLTDYTSYVFLTLIKGTLIHASHSLIPSRDSVSAIDQEDSIDATNLMIHVTEALKDHAETILTTPQVCYGRATCVLACFQGFSWGLSSALSHMDAHHINIKAIFSRRNFQPVDNLRLITKCLCEVVLNDSSLEVSSDGYEKRLNLENLETGSANIKTSFLQSLLEEENIEACLFLRRLFISYSAILRLNSQIKAPLSSKLVAIFIQVSDILLSGFSKNAGTPSDCTFVLLDGIGKFLEELGHHLSSSNESISTLPPKVYERLIDLHLKAIGKCISLQGKEAALESHETESSTKTVNGLLSGSSCLDELKSRLRVSFKVFVGKPSEVYISSALQSIKRALVGRQEGGMANYQICTGSSGGGNVSSVVAAGVDCLDLVLEAITGRKSLNTVKTDILGSICCLFNIILHLEGPHIFYRGPTSDTHYSADPDSGSVILMCIEVVTKVLGKHALYQMDACYVAQAFSIPATLFQNILQALTRSALPNEGIESKVLDRQYLIELYAACCRMLHTLLRHHKRESLQHIALLEASVSVLLHCLEMVNSDQKGHFVWGLQEAVKCGAFLRRIYEEIRQQKDVIGENCRLFLSTYIVVYSGYGPLKAGIRREIDEALRPGVYALIDACSSDDLQYIHTLLGEGPCRNTLANLQHDYKLNFQYQGKV